MISRALAGILLGSPLSFMLAGTLTFVWPGPWHTHITTSVVLFFLLWTAIVLAAFMMPGGRRCWGGLTLANLLAFAMLETARLAADFGNGP